MPIPPTYVFQPLSQFYTCQEAVYSPNKKAPIPEQTKAIPIERYP